MLKIIESFATRCPCWGTNLTQQSLDRSSPGANANYQTYYANFRSGNIKLMLHSLGCARKSADYQAERWNVESNNNAIAHAVIDSEDGYTRQVLRWDMRSWHCGNPGNNLAIGVEMCESDAIKYDKPKAWQFSILDRETALRHCETAYNGAVELFAYLCRLFNLDPFKAILSHKEGSKLGIASDHVDPEHYWNGLGIGYTMDGFREDVAAKMAEQEPEDPTDGTEQESKGFLGFPDVSADEWFAPALKWAVDNKIILQSGKPFRPDSKIDKATLIVLLRRLWTALLNAKGSD